MRTFLRYFSCTVFTLLSMSMIIVPTMIYTSMDTSIRGYLWLFIIPVAVCFLLAALCIADAFPFLTLGNRGISESESSMVVTGSRRSYYTRSNRIDSVDEDFFYVSGDKLGTQESRSTPGVTRRFEEPDTRYHSTRMTTSKSEISTVYPHTSGSSHQFQTKTYPYNADEAECEEKAPSHTEKTAIDILQPQAKRSKSKRQRNYTVDCGSDDSGNNPAVLEALAIHEDVPAFSPSPRTNWEEQRPWKSLEKKRTMPDNMDIKTELEKSNSWPQAYTKALLEVTRNLDLPLQICNAVKSEDRPELILPKTNSREKVKDWLFDYEFWGDGSPRKTFDQFSTAIANIQKSQLEKPKSDEPNKFVILGRGYFYACETDNYVRVESTNEKNEIVEQRIINREKIVEVDTKPET